MVLFEVLCGRLCTVKEDDGLFLSAKLIKEFYQNDKLEEIVHPMFRTQMSTLSMYKFSSIAYGCLHDDREQRPTMNVVKEDLEEMLKIELSQSGYLAIEAAPTDKPVAVPDLRVGEFKKLSPAEAAPTDTQPINVQSIDVPALQVDELKKITYNFSIRSKIGEGSFGTVFVGVLRSGQTAAIKLLDSSAEQPAHEFLAQVSRVSRLKHDNVVQMLGYCVDDDLRILAYEYAMYGSLRDILHGAQKDQVLSWTHRVKIAIEAAEGLKYLHENNIIHRDLKSNNVLLFDDLVAKIGDIALSDEDPDLSGRSGRSGRSDLAFNFGSHAPEYALTGHLDSRSDIYSFGVVLLELLTGRKPIDRNLPANERSLVTWATPKLSKYKVRQCVDARLYGEYSVKGIKKMAAIADKCLKIDPKLRPKATILVKELQSVSKHSSLPRGAPAPRARPLPTPLRRPPARPLPTPPPPPPPSKVSHLSLFMCCCRRQA
ncbi:hypothetical protein QVD17_15290 [Tagetes erecta]|uniref:Protein kinase domain-containing protein n=1 Tax=Tagetes erecta TaxID=13708 RepID=A0AAD8KP03_TARER|nr:hypothetical protein QVD17_15290 [Tagetes erecta]